MNINTLIDLTMSPFDIFIAAIPHMGKELAITLAWEMAQDQGMEDIEDYFESVAHAAYGGAAAYRLTELMRYVGLTSCPIVAKVKANSAAGATLSAPEVSAIANRLEVRY